VAAFRGSVNELTPVACPVGLPTEYSGNDVPDSGGKTVQRVLYCTWWL